MSFSVGTPRVQIAFFALVTLCLCSSDAVQDLATLPFQGHIRSHAAEPVTRSRAHQKQINQSAEVAANRRSLLEHDEDYPVKVDRLPEPQGDNPDEALDGEPADEAKPLIAQRPCASVVATGLHMKHRMELNRMFGPSIAQALSRWGFMVKRTPQSLPFMTMHRPYLYAPRELGHSPRKAKVWKSCALVGSAGVLKGSGWGPQIDKDYEAVIRLNNAPTRGFEKDVGKRTTVRFIQDWHLKERNFKEIVRTETEGVVMVWPSPNHPGSKFGGPKSQWAKENVAKMVGYLEKNNTAVLMTRISDMIYHTAAALGQRHNGRFPPYVPSSGWYGFIMALNLCSSLDIIGYSWDSAKETVSRRLPDADPERKPAYYFRKHEAGAKDEADYYKSRIEKSARSHHKLESENNAVRRLAQACGVRMR